MSGLLQGFVWRGVFPKIDIYGKHSIDLNHGISKAVLARIADACHDSGSAMWKLGRCIIAEDVSISADRVKKIQAAWEAVGVLRRRDESKFAIFEIDVQELVSFVPEERLPDVYKAMRNRVAHNPVGAAPGCGGDATGLSGPDLPGCPQPPSNESTNVTTNVAASPSGGDPDGPPDGSPEDEDADADFDVGGKPLSEAQRKARDAKRNLQVGGVVEWICDGYVSSTTGRWLGLQPTARPDDARVAVLALAGSARKRAESFVVWAQNIVTGRPQKPPIAEVRKIIAALNGPQAAMAAQRCEMLLAGSDRERAPP